MNDIFNLNAQSSLPLYQQVIEQVRLFVTSGILQIGDELPSVRAVASAHGINPMTVSKAYGLLEAEGYLRRNAGTVMTVANCPAHVEPLRLIEALVDELVSRSQLLKLSRKQLLDVVARQYKGRSGQ